MIRSAPAAKVTALGIALAAHAALAYAIALPADVRTEGAGGAAEVRLGNAFRDMSAGTLTPQTAADAIPEAEAETTARQAPDPLADETPAPTMTEEPPERMIATRASASLPVRPQGAMIATASAATALAPLAVAPVTREKPVHEAAQPAPHLDTITGAEPESPAVSRSLRPKSRSAEFEARHEPARQGATQTTRAGEASGQPDAATTRSGSGGQQQAIGNAASSNYPGLVMRKLSRAGKPRVNARGAALVAFTIGGNGRLASVSLARSSGSSELDRAALRLVRSAGPFPKPPQGAQRSFSIQIKGQ